MGAGTSTTTYTLVSGQRKLDAEDSSMESDAESKEMRLKKYITWETETSKPKAAIACAQLAVITSIFIGASYNF